MMTVHSESLTQLISGYSPKLASVCCPAFGKLTEVLGLASSSPASPGSHSESLLFLYLFEEFLMWPWGGLFLWQHNCIFHKAGWFISPNLWVASAGDGSSSSPSAVPASAAQSGNQSKDGPFALQLLYLENGYINFCISLDESSEISKDTQRCQIPTCCWCLQDAGCCDSALVLTAFLQMKAVPLLFLLSISSTFLEVLLSCGSQRNCGIKMTAFEKEQTSVVPGLA